MIVCSLQDESQFHYNNWLLFCFFKYVSRPVDCWNLTCPVLVAYFLLQKSYWKKSELTGYKLVKNKCRYKFSFHPNCDQLSHEKAKTGREVLSVVRNSGPKLVLSDTNPSLWCVPINKNTLLNVPESEYAQCHLWMTVGETVVADICY